MNQSQLAISSEQICNQQENKIQEYIARLENELLRAKSNKAKLVKEKDDCILILENTNLQLEKNEEQFDKIQASLFEINLLSSIHFTHEENAKITHELRQAKPAPQAEFIILAILIS